MVNIQNKFIPSRIISKILFTALLFFFISCLCLSCLFADTNVGGEITQDTTWTFAPNPPYNNGSPYIVIDTVTVNQGVTLTIEPGVQVKFAGNRSLIINGSLVAQGTQIQPITFTSNRPNPAPRDWQSIFFADTSDDTTCIVSYAIIEYATTSIYITNASPRIEYNTVRNNPNGITADNSSSPTITNNTIENNTYGIYCQDSSSPAITNNTLQNNTYGIYCQYSSSSAITNNTIINNEYGIYTSGSLTNYPNPFINNNSIYNNTQYNLYAYASNNCSSLTINAQNNWWGTVDVITITQKIYDYTDNPNSPAVDFIPFLDGPNGSPIEGNFVLGSINQNTTWTQAQSPYIVVGSINVLQAITLTIEPGVQIKFA
ncbi:MAG: NosD domain-containing protein, partial [Candidatus Omnitrophota bacterium]|nr:NosD domain-containing protein [Candidatus Omnitrophota bacterium]